MYHINQGRRDLRRFPIAAFVVCLMMAWIAEHFFGVADITGAFAAGLMIGATKKAGYIASKFEPVQYLFLAPVFFASIGMTVVLPAMSTQIVIFSVLLVVVAVLSKWLGCGVGACLVCACKSADGHQKHVCKDGPVFDSKEVSWDD